MGKISQIRLTAPGVKPVGKETNFKSYKIINLLGQGGLGQVWKAIHRVTGKTVALKIPHILHDQEKGLSESQKKVYFDTFSFEASLGQKLPYHPGLPKIFEVCSDGPNSFIAMEKIEGLTLEKVFNSSPKEPMHLGKFIETAKMLLDTIGFLHSFGVMHMDIKPENIFFTKDSRNAILVDLGLGANFIGSGIIGKTPLYASPEQNALSKDINGLTDIYSLGMVLNQLLDTIPIYETGLLSDESRQWLQLIIDNMSSKRPGKRGGGKTTLFELERFEDAHRDLLYTKDLDSYQLLTNGVKSFSPSAKEAQAKTIT